MGGGRLGVYAALGASAGALPVPWLPEALARRVRGALVHDVAARHGLSLANDARDALADPARPEQAHGALARTMRSVGATFALRRLARIGPLGALWPLRHALSVFALGHLFDRYLARRDAQAGARIGLDEAVRVRRAVDGALLRAVSVTVAPEVEREAAGDDRDPTTALVDGLLEGAAGVPERLVRRLDAAFDELVAAGDG
jgi:hypothetical protein